MNTQSVILFIYVSLCIPLFASNRVEITYALDHSNAYKSITDARQLVITQIEREHLFNSNQFLVDFSFSKERLKGTPADYELHEAGLTLGEYLDTVMAGGRKINSGYGVTVFTFTGVNTFKISRLPDNWKTYKIKVGDIIFISDYLGF